MDTRILSESIDAIAPDGSEIRLLAATGRGSMAHRTLPAGRTTLAVRHRTVEEVWYCLGGEGEGEVWRRWQGRENVTAFRPGVSLSIPLGAHFQFRAGPRAPLRFVIVTMPPWPGEHEAERVPDHWPTE
jgi:mannose-6-phosphate isomerase-like protein (cupin superfamily)